MEAVVERSKEESWSMPVATFERMFGTREEIRRLEIENNLLKKQLLSAQAQIKKLQRRERLS
ncbi:MAG: hypothetical protein OXF85_01270 [Candidatus Saccharibacteria bacterium]|nr:hypothetical protein [Candidatus Saccharibacteria bacterium]